MNNDRQAAYEKFKQDTAAATVMFTALLNDDSAEARQRIETVKAVLQAAWEAPEDLPKVEQLLARLTKDTPKA